MMATVIRAHEVKEGDTLLPLDDCGKVIAVRRDAVHTRDVKYVTITFTDGEWVTIHPDRLFEREEQRPELDRLVHFYGAYNTPALLKILKENYSVEIKSAARRVLIGRGIDLETGHDAFAGLG